MSDEATAGGKPLLQPVEKYEPSWVLVRFKKIIGNPVGHVTAAVLTLIGFLIPWNKVLSYF